jgi:hypothetical protein
MKITVRQLKRLIKEAISEQMEMDVEDSLSFQDFIADLEQLEMGAE